MSVLQQTGKISLIEIANEFGVTSGPRSLLSFYRGGDNVSATDVVTTSATSNPSNNTPVSDFATVVGLTATADLTTLPTDSSGRAMLYASSNNAADRTLALNSHYRYEAGDVLDVRVYNPVYNINLGVFAEFTTGTISTSPITSYNGSGTGLGISDNGSEASFFAKSYSPGSGSYTSQTHSFTTNITGAGVIDFTSIHSYFNDSSKNQFLSARVRVNPGSDGQAVTVVRDEGTTFANSNSFAVTIAGKETQTVQGGSSITDFLPDSNDSYVISYTPTTLNQTALVAPPSGSSSVSNYGNVTGLSIQPLVANSTPSLNNTQTTQTITLTADTYYNFTAKVVWVTPGANTDLAHGGYQMGSNRADSGVTVGVSVSATGLASNSNRDRGTFYNGVSQGTSFTGQPLLAVTDLARGGGRHANSAQVAISITVTGTPSADTELTFYPNASSAPSRNFGNSTFSSQTLTHSTAIAGYDFTNNTGNNVTISGSGVTSTTITNGNSTSSTLEIPDGNFTIQHQIANPQAINGNIPSDGRISLTNFYGTSG